MVYYSIYTPILYYTIVYIYRGSNNSSTSVTTERVIAQDLSQAGQVPEDLVESEAVQVTVIAQDLSRAGQVPEDLVESQAVQSVSQETSNTQKGKVLSQVIRTKEGIEPPLVTETEPSEPSLMSESPLMSEHSLMSEHGLMSEPSLTLEPSPIYCSSCF